MDVYYHSLVLPAVRQFSPVNEGYLLNVILVRSAVLKL